MKFKKATLAFGSLAAIAAPIASVVSCGSDGYGGRFDQANDGIIKVMTSLSSGGSQEKALITQINQYNEEMKNEKGFMPVEIAHIEGGYGAMTPSLITKFEAGDTKTLPNLVLAYADTLGAIVKYDMQLNMEESETSKTLRNAFEEKFIEENDHVGGLDGSKGTYLTPLAKSTDVLNVNKQVIGYLIKTINTVKTTPVTLMGKVKEIVNESNANVLEFAKIAGIWGIVDKTQQDLIDEVDLTDGIFNTYTGLLNFAAKAQDLFPKTDEDKDLHVLGEDSSTTLLYEMAYAELGTKPLSDPHSFLFNKAADGYISHDFKTKGSDEQKAFEKVYEMMRPALQNGGLYFNIDGAYSSELETKHKIGIAFGSTAGYSHNYLPDAGNTYTFNEKELEHVDEFTTSSDEGVIGIFGSRHNKILDSTYTGDSSSYDIKLSVELSTSVKKLIESGEIIISSDTAAKDVTGAICITPDDQYPKYIFKIGTDVTKNSIDTTGTLQESELEIMADPGKLIEGDKGFVFSQGPSIVGLHSGDAEDDATRMFVKWLVTADATISSVQDSSAIGSPLATFNQDAGYIDVTKGAFDGDELAKSNPATGMAYKKFKEAIGESSEKMILTNPVDDTTATLRDNIRDALNAQYNLRAKDPTGADSTIDDIDKLYGLIDA